MVERSPSQAFSDDRPKTDPATEDRLGVAPFAETLARSIVNQKAPNGFVIALHGQWGSGKSTVINFVRAHIEAHNVANSIDSVTPIDFRPWIVSGHQDMVFAFFKVLEEHFRGEGLQAQAAGLLDVAKRRLSGSTGTLADAAIGVAGAVNPILGVAVGLGKAGLTKAMKGVLEGPSLQSAYETLRTKLASDGRRFLVTIDDIDRLEPAEIRAIMQLVKSVGQLPNVTYLLAYDTRIVSNALADVSLITEHAPQFMEKIVQHSVELPLPLREDLLGMFDHEVSPIFGPMSPSDRWYPLLQAGVHRWLRLPRDVEKLANAIKFAWPALKGEFDLEDLLTMEGMRLFEPVAYTWIRNNRDYLFGEGQFLMSGQDEAKNEADRLLASLPEDRRKAVASLIGLLFPERARQFSDLGSFMRERVDDTKAHRGVGSKTGFETYFRLHLASDVLPRAAIHSLLDAQRAPSDIAAELEGYFGRKNRRGEPLIISVLSELGVRFYTSKPPQPSEPLFLALSAIGQRVMGLDWLQTDLFQPQPVRRLRDLLHRMLEASGPQRAMDWLSRVFTFDGIAFQSDIFVSRARELGKIGEGGHDSAVIDEGGLAALGNILRPRIERAAADGTAAEAPSYFALLSAWLYLAGSEKPREWLTAGIGSSPKFMAKVTHGLLSYTSSASGRAYMLTSPPNPELYDLQLLLEAGLMHMRADALNADERERIQAVITGVQKLMDGKQLSPFGDD